jgi:hypothetical protein
MRNKSADSFCRRERRNRKSEELEKEREGDLNNGNTESVSREKNLSSSSSSPQEIKSIEELSCSFFLFSWQSYCFSLSSLKIQGS